MKFFHPSPVPSISDIVTQPAKQYVGNEIQQIIDRPKKELQLAKKTAQNSQDRYQQFNKNMRNFHENSYESFDMSSRAIADINKSYEENRLILDPNLVRARENFTTVTGKTISKLDLEKKQAHARENFTTVMGKTISNLDSDEKYI